MRHSAMSLKHFECISKYVFIFFLNIVNGADRVQWLRSTVIQNWEKNERNILLSMVIQYKFIRLSKHKHHLYFLKRIKQQKWKWKLAKYGICPLMIANWLWLTLKWNWVEGWCCCFHTIFIFCGKITGWFKFRFIHSLTANPFRCFHQYTLYLYTHHLF